MSFILVAMLMNGFHFLGEAKLMHAYDVDPLDMLTWEGVYATCYSMIAVIMVS